jgi:hypothetical protein
MRGIPFNTYTSLATDAPIPRQSIFHLHPPRKARYKADAYDYREYETQLKIFLQQPRARAALLKGGLIWRLAKEIVDDRLDNEALLGPSEDFVLGGYLQLYANGPQLRDDYLCDTELEFMCGVYPVYTGKFDRMKCGCTIDS